MSKKSRAPKKLDLFGLKFDYADYKERMMPEGEYQWDKVSKKVGLEWGLKATIKTKTENWDCNKIYPTTVEDFEEEFFKKRKPKDLEGVWGQVTQYGMVYYGLVKVGEKYNAYMIQNKVKLEQTSGSFFKDIFNPPEADYGITCGTKFGVFYYNKKKGSRGDNQSLKFKGITTAINTMSSDDPYPVNFEIEYDVTQLSERELRSEHNDHKIMEKKLNQPRSSYKHWPEKPHKVREIPKDHPGFKKYGERAKELEDEKKGSSAVGSGFFVTNKGHIVTNYHVVKNCNKNIKFLYNDEEVDAQLIASDQQLDIALLKAKIENKSYLKFSNKSPQKAQDILVAGFPYGKAISDDLKVTAGIINSLKGIANNTSMLQIDATINPGNSGGPIVDKDTGNLVAIATMKLSKDFTKEAFGVESENTNYGIKSSQVKDFLEANNLKVTVKKSKFKISELESSTVFIFCK